VLGHDHIAGDEQTTQTRTRSSDCSNTRLACELASSG
jgi:hypothetical protein